mmetsp:Transcript_42670/g.65451  ORF Transcript_42670/g.65451 Transcript_42670/m.65451 type:complete len:245 (+) Transcript_42670:461-1195(+)
MLKALNLPKGAKEELNYPLEIIEKIQKGEPLWEEDNKEDGDEDEGEIDEDERKKRAANELSPDQKLMMQMFGEGKYHLIPSFFRTLIFLKKQKREFSVCFRTFGKDLDNIVWEFNQFCTGNHPCYSGRNGTPLIRFDGYKQTKDLRIREDPQKGVLFRYTSELPDTKLLLGTFKRPTNDFDELQDLMANEDEFEDYELLTEPIKQFQTILETLKKFSTMAIQDDYENWKENDFHREVGKLLLID